MKTCSLSKGVDLKDDTRIFFAAADFLIYRIVELEEPSKPNPLKSLELFFILLLLTVYKSKHQNRISLTEHIFLHIT